MINEDLLNEGWVPKECKVGTFWFKNNYVCGVKGDDSIVVWSRDDDMNPLGTADNIQGIKYIQRKHESDIIKFVETKLNKMKENFKETYGVCFDKV
ncbi:hypothetical protein [uncultured Methanobrevibacter sp.]|uniref:hypothetical protein n=1 Tax=uncultured Methanobrevibacter sp. TaxID=253161 RepID=UPI0025F3156E|nr:hypothetical protein [uncultured Methanobrevibacter sp.]